MKLNKLCIKGIHPYKKNFLYWSSLLARLLPATARLGDIRREEKKKIFKERKNELNRSISCATSLNPKSKSAYFL